MRFTRARDLAVAGVVAGIVVRLLLALGYGSLPPLPTPAGATLFVLAVLEAAYGFALRPRLAHRPGTRPVPALTAARAVALAKASSLFGAIMAGAWLGVLAYVVPRGGSIAAADGDTTAGVVGLVSAAALIAAALWLEHCLRTPEDREERDPDRLPRSG